MREHDQVYGASLQGPPAPLGRGPRIAIGVGLFLLVAFVLGLMFPQEEPRNPALDLPNAYSACVDHVREALAPERNRLRFHTYRPKDAARFYLAHVDPSEISISISTNRFQVRSQVEILGPRARGRIPWRCHIQGQDDQWRLTALTFGEREPL